MERAYREATSGLKSNLGVDAIFVVQVDSWAYADPGGDLAERLGLAAGVWRFQGPLGGNAPVELIDRAAQEVYNRQAETVLVTGAESAASISASKILALEPPWARRPGGPVVHARGAGGSERMWRYGNVLPIRNYPLFENALRLREGRTLAQAQAESGTMYERFSQVAAASPYAWFPTMRSAREIVEPSLDNRMICFPYTLRMNAFPRVDQGAAIIVTSYEKALALGVSSSDMVFVWGGAGARDPVDVYARESFAFSLGLERSLRATLERARVDVDSVDLFDLYSCFPVVPKLAARVLGLDRGQGNLTVTGGLSFFGGPGNSYSLHAVTAMTKALRRGDGSLGLIYGNGEFLTKHHSLLLGSSPLESGFHSPGEVNIVDHRDKPPEVADTYEGSAGIETFTVEFDKENQPKRGYVVARGLRGERVPASVRRLDDDTLSELLLWGAASTDQDGWVKHDDQDEKNYFEVR